MELESTLAANLIVVKDRVSRAAASAGRAATDIRLIAVSKTFSVAHVQAAVAIGLRDLGENKIQEALHKQAATAGLPASWHFIGHLQSNKARKAVAFDWVHSVDSVNLLRRLEQAAAESGRSLNLLVQVDLAGESTKHGASEAEVYRMIDLATECQSVCIRGLMVLPPWSEDPEATRPYFRRLRQLGEELRAAAPESIELDQLSMGMSHDLEVAVEEGATMVRIGTALFGHRPAKLRTV